MGKRSLVRLASALAILGGAAAVAVALQGGSSAKTATTAAWTQQRLHGSVRLTGQVPLVVRHARTASPRHARTATLRTSSVPNPGATYLHPHPKPADIG